MQVKYFLLVLSLALGSTSIVNAAQLSNSKTTMQKETSIVKNVAASLKPIDKKTVLSKQTNLDQLLRNPQQLKIQPSSSEEVRALASINNKFQSYFPTPNKHFGSFLQSLFGG
ncbi:hypothetical protein F4V57_10130 [Acinetobacter qingfengensis]|nr:hypothetical protein [Acinetobacter qingfengensis]KAA8732418.1 hypothetical protein F4V57_10130 [Acinetobacter qingfengensis]